MTSPEKAQGVNRILNAFTYSYAGFKTAYKSEAAFRQEIWLFTVLLPIALLSPTSFLEKALLIGCMLVVLIVELFNSAIEAVVDRVSAERHPLSKAAKDMGSAAVLIAFLNLMIIWSGVFLNKLIPFLN